MRHDTEPSTNGRHVAAARDIPARAGRRAGMSRAGPRWAWAVLGAGWLFLMWAVCYDYYRQGVRDAGEALERRGGMSPETYRKNFDRGLLEFEKHKGASDAGLQRRAGGPQ